MTLVKWSRVVLKFANQLNLILLANFPHPTPFASTLLKHTCVTWHLFNEVFLFFLFFLKKNTFNDILPVWRTFSFQSI